MRLGRHGAYLRVDLSTGESESVSIPADVSIGLLGGVGLGTWICLAEGGAAADPLAVEAPLVFCFSPLVGTPLTTSAKFAVFDDLAHHGCFGQGRPQASRQDHGEDCGEDRR